MGILAMNIRNGLIIIDEPELHLHPRWQIVLLDLVKDLIDMTGNQFLFTTHSPTFIRRETIAKVLRVYQDEDDSSRVDRVTGFESDSIADLVHVINSYNNEKMFFADDVVLVEGIKDRLIFQALIDYYLDETDDPRIIEVLEVDGKENFEKYTPLLNDLSIPHFIIADRDYADDIGGEDITDMFVTSERRIVDRVLKDPDSRDHQALAKRMDDAIASGDPDDMERVREVWDHIGRRLTEFKSELTEDEQETWDGFRDRQAEEGIYILPYGELRAHDGPTDVQEAIEITKEENFDEWVSGGGEGRSILKNIAREIVSHS